MLRRAPPAREPREPPESHGTGAPQRERAVRAEAQRSLDTVARALAPAGWRVRTAVREGVPLSELLGAVRRENADLLVLGGRGPSGLERLLLGSTAEGALKRCPVPVLIVN